MQLPFQTAIAYLNKGNEVRSIISNRIFCIDEDVLHIHVPDREMLTVQDNADVFTLGEVFGPWEIIGSKGDVYHLPGYESLSVLGARMIIRPVPIEETTSSGLILTNNAKEPKFEGLVVVTGDGVRLENGKHMPMEVEIGMNVLYSQMAGVPIKHPDTGEDLLVINERDIIGIITGDN